MMLLYVLLVFLQNCHSMESKSTNIIQDSGFKIAKVGSSVTLQCSCQDITFTFFTWHQQKLGGKPQGISNRIRREPNSTIKQKFQPRFKGFGSTESDRLIITDLQLTDSATYFCGVEAFGHIEFGEGIFVHVQPSTSHAQFVVQQQTRKQLWQGDSLNLNCTVEADQCPGEKSFYWFRPGTSQPAIIYPGNSDCQMIASKKSCTVKLSVETVKTTDAGIYYCALASCGEIIFGNGTTVEIDLSTSHRLIFWLTVALGLSIITTIILAITVYKLKRKMSASHRGDLPRHADVDMSQVDINYAALNINWNTEPQNQEDIENACMYSSVRSRKL